MGKEQLLSFFKEISPKYLIALYMVLMLAIAVIVSSVVLLPQERRIAEKQQQLQQEKQKVGVIESFILSNPDMDKHLMDLQQSMNRAEMALPGSMDVSAFMAQIEIDAREAGVKISNVKPGTIADRAGYRELPVEISVDGTFFATMSFLKKLEDGARFSVPAAFLIQQKQNLLSTRINLQIFAYGVPPRPAATAAPPGTPVVNSPTGR